MKIKNLLFTAVLSTTALCSNVFAQDIILQSEDAAELFDFDGAGLKINDNAGVENIDSIKDGDWVKYTSVDLTNIVNFSMSVASNRTGDKTVTLHLDDGVNGVDLPGTAVGTITQSGKTGGWQTYVDSDIATLTQTVTGVQNVYFVFGVGDINIDYFTLHKSILSVSDNVKETQINFYPNPVADALTIEMPIGDYNQYTILDVSGKVIKEETIQNGLRKVELNVSDLSKGMYLINLKGIESKTFKFIKE
ncbi:MAG: carbohydrate-binding protein [Algibacter sp.]